MRVGKLWLPYHMGIHSGIRSAIPLDEEAGTVISLRAREAGGRILQERWLKAGEPITGVSSLVLDVSPLDPWMKESVTGCIEVTLISDRPCREGISNVYVSAGGFTSVLYGPLSSFNVSGKGIYRGFSVHRVSAAVEAIGLVVVNVSSDLNYARLAPLRYEVRTPAGELLRQETVEIPPFGTRWLGLEEFNGRGEEMLTMFGSCDSAPLLSFLYTAVKGGRMGLDHTQPPLSQWNYGEDVTPGLNQKVRRFRERLGLFRRYRTGRLDS